MLILLLFLAHPWISDQSEDFENAKILGLPRLLCSKKALTFAFDTNIPFQGRISVIKKVHRQACVQDYSANIQRNASFKVELQHCMELTYMNNGSRLYSAQIEVGFHPLVITSNDRLFSVRCIDNSHAASSLVAKKEDNACVHSVRLASRWESSTVFHVGDAVIHEWNCNFTVKDDSKYQTFLTSCNAISNAGQVIHLIDENGCIVDSELMGEIVYNSMMPKIFARARVFKLMNEERYRIECQVQMCTTEGVCKDRAFPPKCAFTKEEILSRYMSKPKVDAIEDTIMTGSINNRFERQVKVVSEWITVHNNQYTNIEQLHERYYLSTVMDDNMEEPKEQKPMRHFLMGISYRDPNGTETVRNETFDANISSLSHLLPSVAFRPIDAPFTSLDVDDLDDAGTAPKSLPVLGGSPVMSAETSSARSTTDQKRTGSAASTSAKDKSRHSSSPTTKAPATPKSKATGASPRLVTEISKNTASRESAATKEPSPSSALKQTSLRSDRTSTNKPTARENTESTFKNQRNREMPATLQFYSTSRTTPSPSNAGAQANKHGTNQKQMLVSEVSAVDNKVSPMNSKMEKGEESMAETDLNLPTAGDIDLNNLISKEEKFANPRDWRLDDRTINDTDIMPERQVACSNATIIASQRKCAWSGIEHLLVIWSFASLLVWMVMIAVCFYRQANKPSWVEFRERELQRMAQSRVLQHDHPWVHADAFEESRSKNKNELTMIQGTF